MDDIKGVDWSARQSQPVAEPEPVVPTPVAAADVATALDSLNYTKELFGDREGDTVSADIATALDSLNYT